MSSAPWKPATTPTCASSTAPCGVRDSSVCRAGRIAVAGLVALVSVLGGCRSPLPPPARPSPVPPAPVSPPPTPVGVAGDEIIVAGRKFHTGTRVVTWLEPGGYDGHAKTPVPRAALAGLPPSREFAALEKTIDQFVLHYDGCGLSRICF